MLVRSNLTLHPCCHSFFVASIISRRPFRRSKLPTWVVKIRSLLRSFLLPSREFTKSLAVKCVNKAGFVQLFEQTGVDEILWVGRLCRWDTLACVFNNRLKSL
jgi:hypothetical protein